MPLPQHHHDLHLPAKSLPFFVYFRPLPCFHWICHYLSSSGSDRNGIQTKPRKDIMPQDLIVLLHQSSGRRTCIRVRYESMVKDSVLVKFNASSIKMNPLAYLFPDCRAACKDPICHGDLLGSSRQKQYPAIEVSALDPETNMVLPGLNSALSVALSLS